MDIQNQTPFDLGLAVGLGPRRAAHLGIVLKATFRIPDKLDARPEVADEQIPIGSSDEYYRGDITGSVVTEADTVVFKPRADIVLFGTAYAPGGVPTKHLDAGLRVGTTEQVVRVFGDRRWVFPTRLAVAPSISDPVPFTAMPLLYERAFGGFDHKGKSWCPQNHVGRGFIGAKTRESVDGRALPNIEDPRQLIRSWDDHPDPIGLGCYGKSWQPRAALTGQAIDDLDPEFGLAADFDSGFYNGAHPALQVPGYLVGDEAVDLLNVTPDGHRRFRLPGLRPRMTIHGAAGTPGVTAPQVDEETPERRLPSRELVPVLDTLVLLPDDGVFYLVWRASLVVDPDFEAVLARIDRVEARLEDG